MSVAVGLVFGALVAAGLWLALRETFDHQVFARSNYRGHTVAVGAGIIVVFASLSASAVERALQGLGIEQQLLQGGDLVLLAVLALGLLGFIDDIAGDGPEKGFAGHLGALRRGRLTTGGLKLVGGGVVALAVAGTFDRGRAGDMVVDVLLIALCANLANLFDRAPGRTSKVAIVAGTALLLGHLFDAPPGLAVVIGAALGLIVFDLHEQLMLGDAGANVLGGAIGVGLVISCSLPTRVAVLVLVAALNLASEKVSFSGVIDRFTPLRGLDRLGRLRLPRS